MFIFVPKCKISIIRCIIKIFRIFSDNIFFISLFFFQVTKFCCLLGTLFRFPLRDEPSHLSDKLFEEEKVQSLIESFMADAHLLLLFLRHVESVEIYERGPGEKNPKLIYEVRLSDTCLDEVRSKRQKLLQSLDDLNWTKKPITSSFPVSIETVKYEGNSAETKEYRWLVLHQYCGTHISATFRNLQNDKDLAFYPWIGVAMDLDGNNIDGENEELGPNGQLFCFLPLPLEEKSPSGFPVHVNGCFALEHNRKYMKWPNATQYVGITMDKKLMWNHCMLTEALPMAYASLLVHAVESHADGSINGISISTIYKAFPDFSQVERKWAITLPPLYTEVFNHPVIYTSAEGGQWITARDAVFNNIETDTETLLVIMDLMCSGGVKIAEVPSHVLEAIKRYGAIVIKYISPDIISQILKKVTCIRSKLILVAKQIL